MTLTGYNIENSIHNQFDIPKTKSSEVVESLFGITKKTFEIGDAVLIKGNS